MIPFGKPEDLVAIFSPLPDTYVDLTPFVDDNVAFSLFRDYPTTHVYSPIVNKQGRQNTVAMIQVMYRPPASDSNRAPLVVLAVPFNRYLSNHFDYDFDDDDSPTQESIQNAKGNARPATVDSKNQFFVDHHINQIVDSEGTPVTPAEVLDSVYKRHVAPLRTIAGALSRATQRARPTDALNLLIDINKRSLRILCGRELVEHAEIVGALSGYRLSDLRLTRDEKLEFAGCKASRHAVLALSLIGTFLAAVQATGWSDLKILNRIANNIFLAGGVTITALWLFDSVLPRSLLYWHNFLVRARFRMLFH